MGLIHEMLMSEVTADAVRPPDPADMSPEWVHSFTRHPTYIASRADGVPCYPIAVYLDGVRYTKSIAPGHMDTLLNLRAYNLMTGKRHMIALLKSSEKCRCGCGGWC
eukprot:3741140-Pyramimonas_sp.AAC.1